MNVPQDLKYTKDHEWARIEGKTITVGVTDHAQNALGDIVFVDLPEIGRELQAGETFGVVESIKAVSDLYAPVSGKVLEINEQLRDEPSGLNHNPYDSWIVKVELSGEPPENLMDAAAYQKYIESLA